MTEKFEYDDNIVKEFYGDVDDSFDDEPVEKPTETTAQDTTEQVEKSQEQATEQPEQEVKEITEEPVLSDEDLTTALEESSKGDINIALHKEREKGKQYKYENQLKEQEIELLKQQISLLGTKQPEIAPTVTEPDILNDLEDDEMLTKGQFLEGIKQFKSRLDSQSNVVSKDQEQETARQMGIDFNASHGAGLGELSYQNIYQKVAINEIELDQGQLLNIENAVTNGKNPAELLYNYAIANTPGLTKQVFNSQIKGLLSKKIDESQSINPVVQSDTLDVGLKNNPTGNSHVDDIMSEFF